MNTTLVLSIVGLTMLAVLVWRGGFWLLYEHGNPVIIIFVVTWILLPIWVLIAALYGVYKALQLQLDCTLPFMACIITLTTVGVSQLLES